MSSHRSCGDCQACCVVFRVDELDKAAREPCKNLIQIGANRAGGCGIHDSRPPVCRHYECVWLQGFFKSVDRPDLLGLIVSFAEEDNELRRETGIQLMVVNETWEGAAETEEAKAFLSETSRKYLIALVRGARRTLVGPPDLVELAFPVLEKLTKAELGKAHAR